MSFEFKFPDVGEGLTEGKLVKWLVKVGDTISADQAIAEVETDKAVVEVPIPQGGTVEKLLYKEGDTMIVDQPMIVLSDGNGVAAAPATEAPKEEMKADEPAPIIQASAPTNAPAAKASYNAEIKAMPAVRKKAQEMNINLSSVTPTGAHGQVTMADLNKGKNAPAAPASVQTPTQPATAAPAASSDILATPSTRKLARELGVDINTVKGTGDHGAITKDDIQKAAGKGITPAPQPTSEVRTEHLEAKPPVLGLGSEERVPMSGVRKAIAKKMVQSKHTAPHITITDEADVTELVAIREKEKDKFKERGIKLTYLPFFIKALVTALKQHPMVNAQLDDEKQEIIVKKYYHMGVATDTEVGLMVCVVKDADHKSIVDLAIEIVDLVGKAQQRKLTQDQMNGSTFTITSLGNLGGQVFTPIINYPEVAILGIGGIRDKAVVHNGEITIRKMCMFSVSADHRVIDGAEAARFLTTFIKHIEDPDLLFMEMI